MILSVSVMFGNGTASTATEKFVWYTGPRMSSVWPGARLSFSNFVLTKRTFAAINDGVLIILRKFVTCAVIVVGIRQCLYVLCRGSRSPRCANLRQLMLLTSAN